MDSLRFPFGEKVFLYSTFLRGWPFWSFSLVLSWKHRHSLQTANPDNFVVLDSEQSCHMSGDFEKEVGTLYMTGILNRVRTRMRHGEIAFWGHDTPVGNRHQTNFSTLDKFLLNAPGPLGNLSPFCYNCFVSVFFQLVSFGKQFLSIQACNAMLCLKIKDPPHFKWNIGVVVVDRSGCSPIIVIFDKSIGREGIKAWKPVWRNIFKSRWNLCL